VTIAPSPEGATGEQSLVVIDPPEGGRRGRLFLGALWGYLREGRRGLAIQVADALQREPRCRGAVRPIRLVRDAR